MEAGFGVINPAERVMGVQVLLVRPGQDVINTPGAAARLRRFVLILHMFTGTYTALVTPFRDGQVDVSAFERLIKAQIRAGVDGIVPVGTTGESPTLSFEEHLHVIELAVRFGGGKVKVVAGTGGNSTDEAIYLTVGAEKAGADGSLQVAPYYNKPTQEGVFQHFRAISRASRLPLMLYSIPGRCGIEIGVDTVKRLASECPSIVAIKEAGGNVDRVSQLRAALGPKFDILSGDDSLTLPFMSVGACGVVSVASNVAPKEVVRLVRAASEGRCREALKLHDRLYPLFKDLFIESNPGPAKTALAMMGRMAPDVRLPLVPVTPRTKEILSATLKALKLI
jgi:4-hydroxy-tetrahydrodipicolinate synthase